MSESRIGNGTSGMGERESRLRTVLMSYFPMFIAALSLVTSIFNGYLNARFVGIIEGNLSRGEYMRSCKDAVDAYFQVKFRAQVISRNREASPSSDGKMTPAQIEGANAVAHMAALGTYLANLRGEQVRAHYTELSQAIDKAMNEADQDPPAELRKLLEPADRIFADLNADCVKTALERPM
jgi:hypothetical protein